MCLRFKYEILRISCYWDSSHTRIICVNKYPLTIRTKSSYRFPLVTCIENLNKFKPCLLLLPTLGASIAMSGIRNKLNTSFAYFMEFIEESGLFLSLFNSLHSTLHPIYSYHVHLLCSHLVSRLKFIFVYLCTYFIYAPWISPMSLELYLECTRSHKRADKQASKLVMCEKRE